MSNKKNKKVFTIHHKTTDKEDWFDSKMYDKTYIDSIVDPAGELDVLDITSIPSPFARLDLVLSAFQHINNIKGNNKEKLIGNTIYHKTVSDAIDIAEIFFNYESLKENIAIVAWNKNEGITALNGNGVNNQSHKQLGDTLELFLEQDAVAYHFDKMENLYLLEYQQAPLDKRIIGGTSPASLFFTSGNDLQNFVNIYLGGRKLFVKPENNKPYPALFERKDIQFIKYLFSFIYSFKLEKDDPLLAVKDYVITNFNLVNELQATNPEMEILFNELNQIIQGVPQFDNFEILKDEQGKEIKVLSEPLRLRRRDEDVIKESSDFRIDSPKKMELNKETDSYLPPLVLPHTQPYEYESLRYITTSWNANYKVPTNPAKDYTERMLPNYHVKYPWLAVSDFLEPYIISVPYTINNDDFFDGNLISEKGKTGYFLPLKELFFDFFDIDFLYQQQRDGRKNFEISEGKNGAVKVVLRIPIQSGNDVNHKKYVTFERIYYQNMNPDMIPVPDLDKNEGYILESLFVVGLLPKVLVVDLSIPVHYRATFIGSGSGAIVPDNFTLSLRNSEVIEEENEEKTKVFKKPQVEAKELVRGQKKAGRISKFYKIDNNFEYIKLSDGNISGILIPRFNKVSGAGTEQVKFAIDFGTTYTHIALLKDGKKIPFAPTRELATTYEKSVEVVRDLEFLMNWEFVPKSFAGDANYSFPQRTVAGIDKHISNNEINMLMSANIPYPYELEITPDNIAVKSNLKWSDNGVKYREIFLEQLIFQIRNYVLQKGDIDMVKTQFIISHPSSMSTTQVGNYKKLLEKYIEKYFTSKKIDTITESLAPLYYYEKEKKVQYGARPILSIDIGGETTDIVIRKNKNAEPILSSFRFGANVLYGNVYGGSVLSNAITKKYHHYYSRLFNRSDLKEIKGVKNTFEQIIKNVVNDSDLISFFYSFEKNKRLLEREEFHLSKQLSEDNELRIVFLIFYASILYYSLKLMKEAGLMPPEEITFSGTASKMLNFIASESTLETFTKEMIKSVFENNEEMYANINQVNNPKEITAIGALNSSEEMSEAYKLNKYLIFNNDHIEIKGNKDDISAYTDPNNIIKESVINATVKEVTNFIDTFFNIHQEMDFNNYFGIETADFEVYIEVLKQKFETYTRTGIDKFVNINSSNKKLNETFFFYPLIGAIDDLAKYILDSK